MEKVLFNRKEENCYQHPEAHYTYARGVMVTQETNGFSLWWLIYARDCDGGYFREDFHKMYTGLWAREDALEQAVKDMTMFRKNAEEAVKYELNKS